MRRARTSGANGAPRVEALPGGQGPPDQPRCAAVRGSSVLRVREISPVKNLAILGSTGSIGRSALDVVRAHPDKLRVIGLAAGANADLLLEQAAEFHPKVIGMATDEALRTV